MWSSSFPPPSSRISTCVAWDVGRTPAPRPVEAVKERRTGCNPASARRAVSMIRAPWAGCALSAISARGRPARHKESSASFFQTAPRSRVASLSHSLRRLRSGAAGGSGLRGRKGRRRISGSALSPAVFFSQSRQPVSSIGRATPTQERPAQIRGEFSRKGFTLDGPLALKPRTRPDARASWRDSEKNPPGQSFASPTARKRAIRNPDSGERGFSRETATDTLHLR